RGPHRDLGVEQTRRPPAPPDRPSADAVRKAGISERRVRVPGQTPDLVAETQGRQVLLVLCEEERTRFEHQNPLAAPGTPEPQLLGDRGTERAAADDDEVEWPHVASRRQRVSVAIGGAYAVPEIRIRHRLVERVAGVAAEHVQREVGRLRARTDIHVRVLLWSAPVTKVTESRIIW